MIKSQRVFYEVIQENRPCRLYFDLEYDKIRNPHVSGEAMIKDFKELIIRMLHKTFEISISTNDILDLESSNQEKFSRHLVVHTGRFLFSSNYQVGEFVKYIVSQIHDVNFLVKDKEELKIFVDCGVYTKNRNFRLYLSSKLGKARPLMISSKSGCVPQGLKIHDGRLFKVDRSKENKNLGLLESADEANVERFFMNSLVCPWPLPENISLITYKENTRISTKNFKHISYCRSEGLQSPFPEFDYLITQFVCNRVCYPNPDATISKTLFFKDSNTIVYYFINDRYCHRIKRPHKSNGVYYSLQIDKMEVLQKCFDPDCKYYQSPPFSLKKSHIESDDEVFLESLENYEKERGLFP